MFPGVPSPFVDIAPRSGILVWVSERVNSIMHHYKAIVNSVL